MALVPAFWSANILHIIPNACHMQEDVQHGQHEENHILAHSKFRDFTNPAFAKPPPFRNPENNQKKEQPKKRGETNGFPRGSRELKFKLRA
eukprot:1875226-Amphidinium_carterae.1